MPIFQSAFQRRRLAGFSVLAVAFMIAFFHRVSPTVITDQLMHAFGVSATALGSLAAMYYYVYTVMQVPAGVLADRVGPRISVAAGSAVAGVGTLLFAGAPGILAADAGRLLIGLGVATAFVGLMKYSAVWFDPGIYGLVSGLVVLMGNVGAVLGASPLAWALAAMDWRTAFAGLGALSLIIAIAVFAVVRDSPQQAGFAPVSPQPEPRLRESWPQEFLQVAANRRVWPYFLGLFTIVGSFFAFTGLWAVPMLQDVYGLSRQLASGYVTVALIFFALGSFAGGWLSDRLGRRKPMLVGAAAATLAVYLATVLLPWQPGPGAWLLFIAHGLAPAAMVTCYAAAKESVATHHTGMAIAFVNTGLFLGAAILQPVCGLLLDSGSGPGYGADDYARGLWLLSAISAAGLAVMLLAGEPGRRGSEGAAT